jgi:hypothetical protein
MLDRAPYREGVSQLRLAINQSSDLAAQIERGQAAMPLRDHFASLATSLDTAPFTLTLLGLDSAGGRPRTCRVEIARRCRQRCSVDAKSNCQRLHPIG